MTPRNPRLHVLVGVVLAAALALPLAACGKKNDGLGQAGDGGGNGQVGGAPGGGGGDVNPTTPAATTPAPAPTTPPVVAPPPLPWPATEDCIAHNPNDLAVVYNSGQDIWQVVEGGSHYLLAYKREVDAQTALAVAKRHKKHCFIGRNNTRTDRKRYIMDYYREPSGINTVLTNPDCISHDPAALTYEDLGATGWRVRTSGELIALFDTKADAQNAILVMKHYTKHCYIGRGYSGSDRLDYITDFFL